MTSPAQPPEQQPAPADIDSLPGLAAAIVAAREAFRKVIHALLDSETAYRLDAQCTDQFWTDVVLSAQLFTPPADEQQLVNAAGDVVARIIPPPPVPGAELPPVVPIPADLAPQIQHYPILHPGSRVGVVDREGQLYVGTVAELNGDPDDLDAALMRISDLQAIADRLTNPEH